MQASDERNRSGGSGVIERLHWQDQFAGMGGQIRNMPQIVIAAVNGAAVGAGMAIALTADVRIATPSARFLVAAVRIGLTGGESGISYLLPRMIGASRAFDILLTGRAIDAREAERIGLALRAGCTARRRHRLCPHSPGKQPLFGGAYQEADVVQSGRQFLSCRDRSRKPRTDIGHDDAGLWRGDCGRYGEAAAQLSGPVINRRCA